ncbi:MAG: dTDP-4-dehydrorhamnose reductase [Deltaproteobacteria bacterium]|nr:dTDP-4-dehydrorhamnose reductase [Deltaproteobacteria bacterium]
MKILVIGANGQLGWELCRKGTEEGFDIIPLDLPDFDITKRSAVNKAVTQNGASLIINAAAYTAVDEAESEPELAFAVNRDGPAYLASSCAKAGIPLIHISTDYVFDGNKKGPYLEIDTVSPLGVYGKSKAAGEAEVRGHLPSHIILRTAWLYGVHGHNFVKTILGLGREKEVLRVVADQYGCPTFAADMAEAILIIAAKLRNGSNIPYGTYHYCGEGVTTWHGFAEKIIELARRYVPLEVKTLEPITTEEYPTPTKRPVNSVLDCSQIERHFGIHCRPWKESLARMIERLLSAPFPENI